MDCRKLHLLLFVCLTASCSFAHAQNLVPNPSFEEYKKLDCFSVNVLNLLFGYDPKKTFDSLLYSWVAPTDASSALLSTLVNPNCNRNSSECFLPGCTANLLATYGINPKDGNNVIAIALLQSFKAGANGRSYIQTKLDSQLVQNTKYIAGCYHAYNYNGGEWACNNLGMHFSPNAISSDTDTYLNHQPQVNQKEINLNIGVWKKLYGCFTATGEEQYLTIGNFMNDKETKAELVEKTYDQGTDFSNRLIDSVFVEEIRTPFIPNVITPNSDGLNDKFVIEKIRFGWWSLEVVNRWGRQVYQSSDYRNTWTGDDLSTGVYYYELQHRCPGISYKGTITILK